MSLWIFQCVIDILMINVALMWIVNRKRSKFLEAQVDRLEYEIDGMKARARGVSGSEMGKSSVISQTTRSQTDSSENYSHSPAFEKEFGSSFSTPQMVSSSLVEKTAPSKNSSKAEAAENFDRASQMLARGVNVKEISRLTGLSLAELQLMNKIVSRTL